MRFPWFNVIGIVGMSALIFLSGCAYGPYGYGVVLPPVVGVVGPPPVVIGGGWGWHSGGWNQRSGPVWHNSGGWRHGGGRRW
jgi:hypothetical protein